MVGSQEEHSDFERKKWYDERKLRERELALKEEETRLKREEAERTRWTSPIVLAIVGASLAAVGNGIVAWYNGHQQQSLEIEKTASTRTIEGQKAEAALILEVVKTNDPDKAALNLAFLLEAGLVTEDGRRNQITSYLSTRKNGQGPQLAATGSVAGSSTETAQTCPQVQGDYMTVDVHWGDSDGGLVVRTGPTEGRVRIGVIPATGTGIGVGSCESGWCQVRYKCLNGWAFSKYLALRTTRLRRVAAIEATDPRGLVVRKEPDDDAGSLGAVPADAMNLVAHVCQHIVDKGLDKGDWCQITYDRLSGWVPQRFLGQQDAPPVTAAARQPE